MDFFTGNGQAYSHATKIHDLVSLKVPVSINTLSNSNIQSRKIPGVELRGHYGITAVRM